MRVEGRQLIDAQDVCQLRPRPCDPRLHGAEWNVEHLGDLLIVQVDHVTQYDDHSKIVAQPVERGVDRELVVDPVGLAACCIVSHVDGAFVVISCG